MTHLPNRADNLVHGVEVLIHKLSRMDLAVPLDIMERYERALHYGHTSNLLRLSRIEQRVLDSADGAVEEDEAA